MRSAGARSARHRPARRPAATATARARRRRPDSSRSHARAQPLDRAPDAVAHAGLRTPAEQPLGLRDVGPAPLYVDLERFEVLERERVRGLAALVPDDPR